MIRRLVSAAAIVLAAGCADGPTEPMPDFGISWLEWPTAVTYSQPGELHISATRSCTHRPVFRAAIRNNEVQITVQAVRDEVPCIYRTSGSGAGYDTVLALPRLPGYPGQLAVFIRAPMAMGGFIYRRGTDALEESVRVVGYVELGTTPDTTTKLAGFVQLTADSAAACWVAQPFSAFPRLDFAFSRPVPLAPVGSRLGFVSGRLVHATPAICGQPLAIDATELTVDATP